MIYAKMTQITLRVNFDRTSVIKLHFILYAGNSEVMQKPRIYTVILASRTHTICLPCIQNDLLYIKRGTKRNAI